MGPGAVAAQQVRDVGRSQGAEQARSRGGAVAAGAVHDDRSVEVEGRRLVAQPREGDDGRAGDGAERGLPGVADVDDLHVVGPHRPLEGADVEAGGPPRQLRSIGEALDAAVEHAEHVVEADAGQAQLALLLGAGIGDEHDPAAGRDDGPDVLGVPAVDADVDRPGEVAGRERCRVTGVEHDRALGPGGEDLVEVHRPRRRVVEQLAGRLVEPCVEPEVAGGARLAVGDGADELVDRHGLQRVVGRALLADGGHGLGRELLAARRAGPVGGEDLGRVGQREQLLVEGGVELDRELLRGDAHRGEEVGAPHVPDEEGVAGQHAERLGVVAALPHHDADRLGGVARRLTELEHDAGAGVAQGDALAGADPADRELRLRGPAEHDLGSGRLRELQVSGEEVGMEVGLDDVPDVEALRLGLVQVRLDVAPRVDDRCHAGLLVGDQVARVREAVQVVLRELHVSALLVGDGGDHIPPGVCGQTPWGMR